jgi:hypothetical protein
MKLFQKTMKNKAGRSEIRELKLSEINAVSGGDGQSVSCPNGTHPVIGTCVSGPKVTVCEVKCEA